MNAKKKKVTIGFSFDDLEGFKAVGFFCKLDKKSAAAVHARR